MNSLWRAGEPLWASRTRIKSGRFMMRYVCRDARQLEAQDMISLRRQISLSDQGKQSRSPQASGCGWNRSGCSNVILGADAVLIARPFVTAVYGGQEEGITAYVNKIGAELKDTMRMCGAFSLDEINSEMIWN